VLQQISLSEHWKPYCDYLEQRRRLRLVCRAWNEFILFTRHRWLLLEERSPMYWLDSTATSRAKGGVGPVERLSMTINSNELVTSALSWVSHILKRPAHQSPLRAYTLQLCTAPVRGYNPFDDLLVETTTAQGLECRNTNTNTTLRLLSIATPGSDIPILLSQISRTFTSLRSLFLFQVQVTPRQALRLPHLEVLYVYYRRQEPETLQESMDKWDTPALRHVYLEHCGMPLTEVVDRFLGRYTHQIESLVLEGLRGDIRLSQDLPSGFWAQFTALRLLGLVLTTLDNWSGWSTVPPAMHPCRYLVCRLYLTGEDAAKSVVKNVRSRWTWHDGVRFVTGNKHGYYVVKNIRDDPSIMSIERTVGVLPEL
jgi:hypothetical protein